MLILWVPLRNKYFKEYPSPSVVYVVPGVWLPSPSGRWIMVIRHCGSEPLYNVAVGFMDGDRSTQMITHGKTHGTISQEEIISNIYVVKFC
jgi:hypothetical protein